MISDLKLFRFTLEIKGALKEKKGILLQAKGKNGKEAWSEVSPLPGFSKETLLDAEKQLIEIRESIKKNSSFTQEHYPSVAFGLHSLLESLKQPEPLIPKKYPICAFLSGDFTEIQNQIPLVIQSGYTHAKIKTSLLSFKEAHTIIQTLLGKIHLRIDVNRKWSLEESLAFFSRYPKNAFEYIEEPVSRFKDLPFFPFPTALDETIREEKKIPLLPQIKAIIIKPMMTGNDSSIYKDIHLASSLKAKTIISSSHESGVGLALLCFLTERLSLPISPLGIDPYKFIKEDILLKPHSIDKGLITLSPIHLKRHHLCLIN